MANKTAALYIRSAGGYTVPPKKLIDLPVGQTYYLFWYEGNRKRARSAGRRADVARIALVNKESELKRAAIAGVREEQPDDPHPDTQQPEAHVITTAKAVTEFLNFTRVRMGKDGYGASRSTLKAYTRRLSFLTNFDSTTPVAQVDQAFLERFLEQLRKLPIGDRYVYNILQTTLTMLKRNRVNPGRSIMHLAGMGEPRHVQAYTPEQLDRFFAVCDPKEELLFRFFLHCMGRELEIANTEVGDLLFDESVLHIQSKPHRHFRLKGKRSGQAARGRKVPMPRQLMKRLREYVKDKQRNDLLFPNTEGNREGHFHRHCTAIAKRAGLDPTQFDLHKWRKTGATQSYKDGVSVPIIQRWLGHEDIQVTLDYLDVSDAASAHYVDVVSNGTHAARAYEDMALIPASPGDTGH